MLFSLISRLFKNYICDFLSYFLSYFLVDDHCMFFLGYSVFGGCYDFENGVENFDYFCTVLQIGPSPIAFFLNFSMTA